MDLLHASPFYGTLLLHIPVRQDESVPTACTNGRVILAAVGIYSRNTSDDVAVRMRSEVTRMVMAHDGVIQMHGFHVDEKNRLLDFDVILDFALPDRQATYRQIVSEVQAAYPDYKVSVALDVDAAD